MIRLMKKIVGIGTGILSSLAFAPYAFAETLDPCGDKAGDIAKQLCNLGFNDFGTLLSRIITIVLIIAIIIALFFLIYGGIKWILSGGDKTAVEAARNHIVAAIVGIVIVLLAFFIMQFVLGLFGLNLNQLEFPVILKK